MTRILAKVSAAAALSAAIVTSGVTLAGTANAEAQTLQPAPIADSGSGHSLVQSGSGTGSAALDLPTAYILCNLTGGEYHLGISMTSPNIRGCFGGLFAGPISPI
ncbi:hypothetical protein ACFVUS_20250 [Nocardia sp. NPDC058058]|uniref:hypothetical protein n=1 Tax=Nocardia sp. NPDC058058 TaxID=3346317 RepID=UPI0036DD9006